MPQVLKPAPRTLPGRVNPAPAAKAAPAQTNYTGTITGNFSVDQFKSEMNVATFEVKENPNSGKLCMYGDNISVIGAVGVSFEPNAKKDELQVILLTTDEGQEIYILCKRGTGGISDWKTVATF